MPVITDLPGFIAALKSCVADGTFVRAALGKATSELFPSKVTVTPVTVQGEKRLQIVERFPTRDNTKHWSPDEVVGKISAWLGKRFLSATVFTAVADFSVDHNRRLEPRFTSTRPTAAAKPAASEKSSPARPTGLDVSWPWLTDLGLLNAEGKIAKGMERKWRQVEKFLETFDALLRESGLLNGVHGPFENDGIRREARAAEGGVLMNRTATEQRSGEREDRVFQGAEIRVKDMGSGMGYLTFALYAHLERVAPGRARVLGVETRPDLVKACKKIARERGMEHLRFEEGAIGERDYGTADVMVALHACDTATDDALYAAMRGGAKVILSVPCCHKQLRPQLACAGGWGEAMKFGILADRQAEMATDAIRALLLSAHGYRANVAEFISAEHTAKNVLITGVLKGPNPRKAEMLAQVADVKARFGIKEQKLEKLLWE